MAGRAGSGRRPGDVYPVFEGLYRRCRRWVEQSASLWTCRWWPRCVLEQPEAAGGGGVGCSWGGWGGGGYGTAVRSRSPGPGCPWARSSGCLCFNSSSVVGFTSPGPEPCKTVISSDYRGGRCGCGCGGGVDDHHQADRRGAGVGGADHGGRPRRPGGLQPGVPAIAVVMVAAAATVLLPAHRDIADPGR